MEEANTKRSVLVVDDTALYRSYARNILEDYDYTVYLAESGEAALELLKTVHPSIVLLDIIMTGIDGYEVFRRMLANPATSTIPVVFLTAETDPNTELNGFKLGASDFIHKPFVPEIMIHRIDRVIHLSELQNNLSRQVQEKSAELEQITLQVISTIAATVDSRDRYTKGSSLRVAIICKEMAKLLGLSSFKQTELYTLGLLHDIGKISIPDLILNKPTKLTAEEYNVIKKHTEIGSDILKNVTIIPEAHEVARWHHERYDGSGYPDGLSGSNIPFNARIMSLADAYDAMSSKRPYRGAMEKSAIIEELQKSKGSQFDPALTDLMIQLIESGTFDNLETEYPSTHMGAYSLDSNLLLNRIYDERLGMANQSITLDSLTQTYSKSYFEMQLNDHLRSKHPDGYLILCDIACFRKVNDTYGTAVGDSILISLADALRLRAAENDLIGRLGGDEFALYIHDDEKTETDISQMIEAAMADFNAERELLDYKNICAVTFGVTKIDQASADDGYEQIYLHARTALISVHNKKAPYYAFYENIHNKSKHKATRALASELTDLIRYIELRKSGIESVDRLASEEIAFQLMQELASQGNQMVTCILLSISSGGSELSMEEYAQNMEHLRNAIKLSLRHGDFDMQYTDTTYLLVISNINKQISDTIVQRISEYFKKLSQNNSIDLIHAAKKYAVGEDAKIYDSEA